jgi:hypothetical protein
MKAKMKLRRSIEGISKDKDCLLLYMFEGIEQCRREGERYYFKNRFLSDFLIYKASFEPRFQYKSDFQRKKKLTNRKYLFKTFVFMA